MASASSRIAHSNLALALSKIPARVPDLGLLLATTPGRQTSAIPYLETVQRIHPEPAVAQTLARLRGK